jgi:predicted RNA-binding protein
LINGAVPKLLLEEETAELMAESVTIVEVDRISEVGSDTMKSNKNMFGRVWSLPLTAHQVCIYISRVGYMVGVQIGLQHIIPPVHKQQESYTCTTTSTYVVYQRPRCCWNRDQVELHWLPRPASREVAEPRRRMPRGERPGSEAAAIKYCFTG